MSPDGTELFFVRRTPPAAAGPADADIFVSYRRNNAWTAPARAGRRQHPARRTRPARSPPTAASCCSTPIAPGGLGRHDIWAAERLPARGFGELFNLGPTVNSAADEYSPAPTPDGRRLFFATNRKGRRTEQTGAVRPTTAPVAAGDYDLFVADIDNPTAPAAAASTQPAGADLPPRHLVRPSRQKACRPSALSRRVTLRRSRRPRPHDRRTQTRRSRQPRPPGVRPRPLRSHRSRSSRPSKCWRASTTRYHEGELPLAVRRFPLLRVRPAGRRGKIRPLPTRVTAAGGFEPAENLGASVNTAANEADPQLAMGGFHLLFSSDRAGGRGGGYDLLSSDFAPRSTPSDSAARCRRSAATRGC